VSAAPLLTVIVPAFNAGATLGRCLDSVLAQTLPGIEVVVIDGGSSDGTAAMLQKYGGRISYWVSEPDRGIYHALNKGLAHAHGEWIHILGADDWLWSPDVVERAAPHLARAYPPARIVYGEAAFVGERGETISVIGVPWERQRRKFFAYMSLPHQAVFHHRSLFAQRGAFDETFRVAGDYDILLRELRHSDPVFVPGLLVAGYRFGAGTSSHPRNNLLVLREWRRAQRQNGYRWPTAGWVAVVGATGLRVALVGALGDARGRRAFDRVRALFGKSSFWSRT
jgi:glycosyltransferase involved in cell wall biosynthesis